MSTIQQINEASWELALLCVLRAGSEVKAYSTAQIRKVMDTALTGNKAELSKMAHDYSPAPPQSVKQHQATKDIQQKKELNKKFVLKLSAVIDGLDESEIKRLIQYVMWNIKILETKKVGNNGEGKIRTLEALVRCEGEKKEAFASKFKNLLGSNQGPRKSYSGDDNYRRKSGRY